MTSEQKETAETRESSLQQARRILGDLGSKSTKRGAVEVELERIFDEKVLLEEENAGLLAQNGKLKREHVVAEAVRDQSWAAVVLSTQLQPLLGGFPVPTTIATTAEGDSIYTFVYEGFLFTARVADPVLMLDGPTYQLIHQSYPLDPSLGLLKDQWLELGMAIAASRDPKLRDRMPPHVRSALFNDCPIADGVQESTDGHDQAPAQQRSTDTVVTNRV